MAVKIAIEKPFDVTLYGIPYIFRTGDSDAMNNFVNNDVNFSKYAIIYFTQSKREEASDATIDESTQLSQLC